MHDKYYKFRHVKIAYIIPQNVDVSSIIKEMSLFVKVKTKCIKIGTGNINDCRLKNTENLDKASRKDYNEHEKRDTYGSVS